MGPWPWDKPTIPQDIDETENDNEQIGNLEDMPEDGDEQVF